MSKHCTHFVLPPDGAPVDAAYNYNYAAIPTQSESDLEIVLRCRSLNAVRLWILLVNHDGSLGRDALRHRSGMGRGAFNRALDRALRDGLLTRIESLFDESRLRLSRKHPNHGENPLRNGENSGVPGEKPTHFESPAPPTRSESAQDLEDQTDQDPKIHSFPSTLERAEHDLVNDLIAFGVYDNLSRRLVRQYGMEYVRDYLDAMPVWIGKYRKTQHEIKIPAKYLVAAIREGYELPETKPERDAWDMSVVGIRKRERWK